MKIRGFLSYYPLKQGLKLSKDPERPILNSIIFILLSIKTRIETDKVYVRAAGTVYFYPTIH